MKIIRALGMHTRKVKNLHARSLHDPGRKQWRQKRIFHDEENPLKWPEDDENSVSTKTSSVCFFFAAVISLTYISHNAYSGFGQKNNNKMRTCEKRCEVKRNKQRAVLISCRIFHFQCLTFFRCKRSAFIIDLRRRFSHQLFCSQYWAARRWFSPNCACVWLRLTTTRRIWELAAKVKARQRHKTARICLLLYLLSGRLITLSFTMPALAYRKVWQQPLLPLIGRATLALSLTFIIFPCCCLFFFYEFNELGKNMSRVDDEEEIHFFFRHCCCCYEWRSSEVKGLIHSIRPV